MATDAAILEAPPASAALAASAGGEALRLVTTMRNVHMLRVLERIAGQASANNVSLLALKGAALNLTAAAAPSERPMGDLDLLVKAEELDAVDRALRAAGCRPGRPLVRADFFPRYCFEREYLYGRLNPIVIDLHVRPFRSLRFARLMPAEAIWEKSERVAVGQSEIFVPAPEAMLIHLAAHSAMHANARRMWLLDQLRWVRHVEDRLDWDVFLENTARWGLTWPVRQGIEAAVAKFGPFCPEDVLDRLRVRGVSWRDRLALSQAPRDADNPGSHVFVDALCTPGWRFVAGYLAASLWPDRRHMAEWYDGRHFGWRATARVVRLLSPLLRRVPAMWHRLHKLELGETGRHETGVFAARVIAASERIGRRTPHDDGGKLYRIRHSCRPNVRAEGAWVVAIRAIDQGEELSIDYGLHACGCRQGRRECAG